MPTKKTGKLKTILTTFNAKYIHTSLALRWLYVANKDKFDISFSEYTIKEDIKEISTEILKQSPDIVGISVYIWNVELSKKLVEQLKKQQPTLIIIVGGPEVSYEPAYFIENWDIDYLVSGEGEKVLGELLYALENNTDVDIEAVSSRHKISDLTAKADLNVLETYDSPYNLEIDKADLKNRILYFESSRGCPYRCSYCLSSLEKGVRYFSEDYIKNNLKLLINSNVKRIKFLDRTFNLNPTHTAMVFDFLIGNHRNNLSCQFEIYADLLTKENIASLNQRLPKHFFRFEIGIQSTHEPTNQSVNRKQDFSLLSQHIELLMKGEKIDLHLDLIAGLPYEDFNRFVTSFNHVFRLKAKEVQLGFLKMLRGTELRKNAEKYAYVYSEKAPYEVISNKYMSAEELNRLREAEHALEKFWNSGRFTRTMKYLFENEYHERYFDFFDEMGNYYQTHKTPHKGYQLEDLFRTIHNFLLSKGINTIDTLRDDYYSNFTSRPRGNWIETMDKKKQKKLLHHIGNDKEFIEKHKLSKYIIEKQSKIDPLHNQNYLLTVFLPEKTQRIQLTYNYNQHKNSS